jgi:hypothetical protein
MYLSWLGWRNMRRGVRRGQRSAAEQTHRPPGEGEPLGQREGTPTWPSRSSLLKGCQRIGHALRDVGGVRG